VPVTGASPGCGADGGHAEADGLPGGADRGHRPGRDAGAEAGLRQAREIFHRMGAAETSDVTAELNALTKTGPPV
jgi:hypothetical protein